MTENSTVGKRWHIHALIGGIEGTAARCRLSARNCTICGFHLWKFGFAQVREYDKPLNGIFYLLKYVGCDQNELEFHFSETSDVASPVLSVAFSARVPATEPKFAFQVVWPRICSENSEFLTYGGRVPSLPVTRVHTKLVQDVGIEPTPRDYRSRARPSS